MPLFKRDSTSSPPPAPVSSASAAAEPAGAVAAAAGRRGAATLIAPGTRLAGDLGGATDLQIEGEVVGRIAVEALVVVGAGGQVKGPIEARVVRIGGAVEGDVSATERVEVGPTASLEGDIAAPRVVIAEGAFFKGKIDMKAEKNREPRKPSKVGGEAPKAAADAGSR